MEMLLSIQKSKFSIGENKMLETVVLVLVILWLLGLIAGHTFGGWIYLLLVIALAVLVIRFVSGRKTV